MSNNRPTEQELIDGLAFLVSWSLGNQGDMEGNPYSKQAIKNALRLLVRTQGKEANTYLDYEDQVWQIS